MRQISSGQKVAKLDEKQTADMIKITCQRPEVRQGAIHQQFNNINGKWFKGTLLLDYMDV